MCEKAETQGGGRGSGRLGEEMAATARMSAQAGGVVGGLRPRRTRAEPQRSCSDIGWEGDACAGAPVAATLGGGGDACRGASAPAGGNSNAGVAAAGGGACPSTVTGSGGDVGGEGDACRGASAATGRSHNAVVEETSYGARPRKVTEQAGPNGPESHAVASPWEDLGIHTSGSPYCRAEKSSH